MGPPSRREEDTLHRLANYLLPASPLQAELLAAAWAIKFATECLQLKEMILEGDSLISNDLDQW